MRRTTRSELEPWKAWARVRAVFELPDGAPLPMGELMFVDREGVAAFNVPGDARYTCHVSRLDEPYLIPGGGR